MALITSKQCWIFIFIFFIKNSYLVIQFKFSVRRIAQYNLSVCTSHNLFLHTGICVAVSMLMSAENTTAVFLKQQVDNLKRLKCFLLNMNEIIENTF